MRLLFVGLNTIDLQFLVEHYPEANTKVKASENAVAVGGPATNAAICAAFLGADVDLVSPLGRHSFTRLITDELNDLNVHHFDPIANSDASPIFASIITSRATGDRTIFSYTPHANPALDPFIGKVEANQYDGVLFDGFYPELAIPLAQHFFERGIPTILDGGSWKPHLHALLPFIQIAICSDDFMPPQTSSSTDVLAFLQAAGVKESFITRGHRSILHATGAIDVEPIDVVVDTLGAGDFFHGAFSYFYAKYPSTVDAVLKASKVAGESCRHFGTRSWMKSITPEKFQ